VREDGEAAGLYSRDVDLALDLAFVVGLVPNEMAVLVQCESGRNVAGGSDCRITMWNH